MKKPLILLTNDDGIHSVGLLAIYSELKTFADVVVIAPLTEQSAVGHAITVSDPLRVIEIKSHDYDTLYGIKGTPADCVKIGVRALLDHKPDAVISGINIGENTGLNVLYSGTVSAATEGTILGIQSAALSLSTNNMYADFSFAAKFGKKIAQLLLAQQLPPDTLLNVNIPSLPENEIKGIKITRQGLARFKEIYEKQVDPRKRIYYWLKGELALSDIVDPEIDSLAVKQSFISITPIKFQLTDENFMETLSKWDFHF